MRVYAGDEKNEKYVFGFIQWLHCVTQKGSFIIIQSNDASKAKIEGSFDIWCI